MKPVWVQDANPLRCFSQFIQELLFKGTKGTKTLRGSNRQYCQTVVHMLNYDLQVEKYLSLYSTRMYLGGFFFVFPDVAEHLV